ncbi:unnamed protein product [Caenorhabditis bovis]|uniref:C-type lectin domain-containing protein n=1 Tax=Caenorhabditis bovis TaxID=2654633 RepID=A0A8S1EUK0_9PELO|nr:unnamed protein product [Caenorhabditis bovis]
MHCAVFWLIISCCISVSIGCGGGGGVVPCDQRNCPDSTWRKFVRPSGHVVCFKPVAQKVNYAGAVALCSSLASNSKLFGIETQEELDYLKQLGSTWYYIGAFRSDECHANKTELLKRPQCTTDKMFKFTDGVTQGTFLWSNFWLKKNPDSYYRNGEFESVIGLYNGFVGDWSSADVLPGAVCGLALC